MDWIEEANNLLLTSIDEKKVCFLVACGQFVCNKNTPPPSPCFPVVKLVTPC